MIKGTERSRTERTPIFEEGVLYAVDRNPGTSVRALAVATGRSCAPVHRVQQGEALHPFHASPTSGGTVVPLKLVDGRCRIQFPTRLLT